MSGATVVEMSETASIYNYNICFFLALGFSLFHLDIARELSSLFFVGFIIVIEEIYTSLACDFGNIF